MDIFQLYCFITVCKYKGFTPAADELYVTQSTISKRIALLENELGAQLLVRTSRAVRLTPAGEYFYKEIKTLLSQYEQILSKTQRIFQGKKGEVAIGIYGELDFNRLMPGFLLEFTEKHADISIRLKSDGHNQLYEDVQNQELDIAFIPSTHGEPGLGKKVIPINRGQQRLYFSSRNRLAGRPNLTLEDFAQETFVTTSPNFTVAFFAKTGASLYPDKFQNVIFVENLRALRLYVEANIGVAILGPSQNFLNSDTIKSIPLDFTTPVGTDAIWLEANSNPAYPVFLAEMYKYLKLQ